MACLACDGKLTPDQKEAKQINSQIESLLRVERVKLGKEVKLLLLGTGDSGKSTFAKQMKIIYLSGFDEKDRLDLKRIIHINVTLYIRTLLQQAAEFGYTLDEANKSNAELVQSLDASQLRLDTIEFTQQLSDALIALWRDQAIRGQTMARYREFQLSDSATYFLDKLPELSKSSYVPSDSDLLRVRTKTSGIVETEFEILGVHFKMVDVGGQRTERKKWIHCFDSVTAIIFVVAMSEYDLYLEESPTTNRMHESLKLFEDIINNVWFKSTPIILLLNKKDLFQEKIKTSDLRICFPDYSGGLDFEKGKHYIERKFVEKNKNNGQKRDVFTHVTCATDTENIKVVFTAVKKIVMDKLLELATGGSSI